MKLILLVLPILLAVAAFGSPLYGQTSRLRSILYTMPMPNAVGISPTTALAIREGAPLHPAAVTADLFVVLGSQSGRHTGRAALSDDQRTLLFYPDRSFADGETVSVTVEPGLMTADGGAVAPIRYQFTVMTQPLTPRPPILPTPVARGDEQPPQPSRQAGQTAPGAAPRYYTHPEFTAIMTTTVITAAQNTAEGYLFVATMGLFFDGQRALLMLDNRGEPIYIQPMPDDQLPTDFKRQTVKGKAYLTYHLGAPVSVWTNGSAYVLDESYTLVDQWTIGNGYGADEHEFLLLDNGHALLLGYVPVPYNLEPYGGPADATLVDIVIQEQDTAKHIVFEWHGSHHIPLTDTYESFADGVVDYLHTNAIAVDTDGHILISSRNTSEITKINRETGAVIWRLGGKGNQFAFLNDSGFWRQHDVRRLANGHLTLFDNGNHHTPPHSRAVEYAIDETAKTVTRVWQYPEDTSEYSFIMSNAQRLPNGNTLIGWGDQPKVTEVQPDGTVALEMQLGAPSYRAFRFPWQGLPTAAPRAFLLHSSEPTTATLYASWNGATEITGYEVYVGANGESMTQVTTAARTGFETAIPLTGLAADSCFFQVRPVHAAGIPTPYSNLTARTDLPACRTQVTAVYLPLVATGSEARE
ncbi:MAG: aryl-sulfate sulfotransferase [Caldilineaceae bacterium]